MLPGTRVRLKGEGQGEGREGERPSSQQCVLKVLAGLDWHGSRAGGFLTHQGVFKMMAS